MTSNELPANLTIADPELWQDGPPHEVFAKVRSQCPVHWSPGIVGKPDDNGFWSLTRAEDIEAVSRDWKTFSSHLDGATDLTESDIPEDIRDASHVDLINLDPPNHNRLKALFVGGFTSTAVAEHEGWIREAVIRVLDRLDGRDRCDLVADVSIPAVSRVIHHLMGIPESEDAKWARDMERYNGRDDADLNPGGIDEYLEEFIPRLAEDVQSLIADRRANPGDDLLSILIGAEIDGDTLNDEELIYGILLLFAGGNDTTKATYAAAMKALMENPGQRKLVVDNLSLVPDVVEEALRMYPAFTMMRRTATRDVELGGQLIKENDKVVMWYPASNRDPERYEDPDRFDVTRKPEHHAFGGGGRHFCLGNALARLELRILLEETLKRYPEMEIAGDAPFASSYFINQLKSLPVRLGPRAS